MLQTLDSIIIYFEQTSQGRNKVNIQLEIEDFHGPYVPS